MFEYKVPMVWPITYLFELLLEYKAIPDVHIM